MRLLVLRFILISVLLLGSLMTIPSLQAATLTTSRRQEDPRLEKPVSCVASHIYMGELIEKLSKQSGVPMIADKVNGAADVDVTVSFNRISLADAMEALWSLVSYRDAEWDWERTGKAGDYSYRLMQPDAARLLPNTLHEQVETEFQAQADRMRSALEMTPDQLQEAAKTDPLLKSLADGKDNRVQPSMEILASLSPVIQTAILHNHQGFSIPVSQLSPNGRKFVHDQWLTVRNNGGLTKDEKGNLVPVPEPHDIAVSGGYGGDDIAPSLNIDTGFGCGDLVGGGWMEKEWHDKLYALWLLVGDLSDSSITKKVSMPLATRASRSNPTLAYRLMQLAQAVPLPLMARLPDERSLSSSTSEDAPYNQILQDYLVHLQDAKMEHKWRNGVLLLSFSPRLTDPAKQRDAPWSLVKQLRDSEATGDGYLTLGDIAHAAYILTPQQMQVLSVRFPVLASASLWQNALAIYDGSPSVRPALVSPSGCDYVGSLHAVAAVLGPQAEILVQKGSATHVRILVKPHEDRAPGARGIRFELLSDSGTVLMWQGFAYRSYQWRSSMQPSEDAASPPAM